MRLEKFLLFPLIAVVTLLFAACTDNIPRDNDDLVGPSGLPTAIAFSESLQWSTTDTLIDLNANFKQDKMQDTEWNFFQSGTYEIVNKRIKQSVLTGKNEIVDWVDFSFDKENPRINIMLQPNTNNFNRYVVIEAQIVTDSGRKYNLVISLYQSCKTI